MSGRLGELLVRENLISVQQLRKAQEEQQKTGARIGTALIKTGAIEESKLTDFLSKQYGVPAINLKDFDIDPEIIKLVPKDVAEKHLVIPVNRAGPSLIVAMCDPSNIYAVDDLKFLTGYNIEPVVASEISIREAIERYYAEKGPSLDDIVGEVATTTSRSPRTRTTNTRGDGQGRGRRARRQAGEPHPAWTPSRRARPTSTSSPTRRTSASASASTASLYEVMRPPMKLRNAITARLKIMAQLDISERRLPQDGRIKIKIGGGKEMDFRVSVCPTLFGEKVVMRLLDKSNLQLDMTKLGFEPSRSSLVQGGHRPSLRHGAGDGPHGLRQDDDAVLGALVAQRRSTPTSPPPRTRSSSTSPASTRCRCMTTSA